MPAGTFIGKFGQVQHHSRAKLKNFEIRHHLGHLITTVNLEKATFQEAIEFKSLIDDEIDQGFYNIIISLNGCESFDSAFIGVLVVIWKKVQTKGGSLKLVKNGKFDHLVLHLTGAIEIFEKYDSIQEALESYSTPIDQLNASEFLKQANFFKNN